LSDWSDWLGGSRQSKGTHGPPNLAASVSHGIETLRSAKSLGGVHTLLANGSPDEAHRRLSVHRKSVLHVIAERPVPCDSEHMDLVHDTVRTSAAAGAAQLAGAARDPESALPPSHSARWGNSTHEDASGNKATALAPNDGSCEVRADGTSSDRFVASADAKAATGVMVAPKSAWHVPGLTADSERAAACSPKERLSRISGSACSAQWWSSPMSSGSGVVNENGTFNGSMLTNRLPEQSDMTPSVSTAIVGKVTLAVNSSDHRDSSCTRGPQCPGVPTPDRQSDAATKVQHALEAISTVPGNVKAADPSSVSACMSDTVHSRLDSDISTESSDCVEMLHDAALALDPSTCAFHGGVQEALGLEEADTHAALSRWHQDPRHSWEVMPRIKEEEGESEAEAELLKDEQHEAALEAAKVREVFAGEDLLKDELCEAGSQAVEAAKVVARGSVQATEGTVRGAAEAHPLSGISSSNSPHSRLPAERTNISSLVAAKTNSAAAQLQHAKSINRRDRLPGTAVSDDGCKHCMLAAECNPGHAPAVELALQECGVGASGVPCALQHAMRQGGNCLETEDRLSDSEKSGDAVGQLHGGTIVPLPVSPVTDGACGILLQKAPPASCSGHVQPYSPAALTTRKSDDSQSRSTLPPAVSSSDCGHVCLNAAAENSETAPWGGVTGSMCMARGSDGSEWLMSNEAASGCGAIVEENDEDGEEASRIGVQAIEVCRKESIRCLGALQLFQARCAEADETFISGPDEIQDVLGVQRTARF
jgi:hypothetical protein